MSTVFVAAPESFFLNEELARIESCVCRGNFHRLVILAGGKQGGLVPSIVKLDRTQVKGQGRSEAGGMMIRDTKPAHC